MTTHLDDLKTEQELLIRSIKAHRDPAAQVFGSTLEIAPLEERLAVVNSKIAALEEPTDHGGWEDS